MTDNLFRFIAKMVSLRQGVIEDCSKVKFRKHVTELDVLRMPYTRFFSPEPSDTSCTVLAQNSRA